MEKRSIDLSHIYPNCQQHSLTCYIFYKKKMTPHEIIYAFEFQHDENSEIFYIQWMWTALISYPSSILSYYVSLSVFFRDSIIVSFPDCVGSYDIFSEIAFRSSLISSKNNFVFIITLFVFLCSKTKLFNFIPKITILWATFSSNGLFQDFLYWLIKSFGWSSFHYLLEHLFFIHFGFDEKLKLT